MRQRANTKQPTSRIAENRFFKSKTTSIFAPYKQHAMKKTIILTALFCNILLSFAGDIKTSPGFISASVGFAENKGQIVDQNNNPNPLVKYLFAGNGLNLQLRQSGFSYDVWTREGNVKPHKKDLLNAISEEKVSYKLHRIDLDFQNSNSAATISANSPLDGYFNYYTTGTNNEGATHVKSYREVIYKNIWRNIDIVFFVNDNWVKYNIILNPGANIADVQFNISGAPKIIEQNGNLLLKNSVRDIHETIPYSFIENQNNRTPVKASFKKFVDNIYGFSLDEEVSKNAKVVIDPTPERVWGTYFGGSDDDATTAMTSDQSGNLIIVGKAASSSNIATVGSHQSVYGGNDDAFIAKFDSNGVLIWSTYYGGSSADYLNDVTTDPSDNIIAGGETFSANNIATPGAYQDTYTINTGRVAFFVKLNASGVRQWASYYKSSDAILGIATDNSSNILFTGWTQSTTGIATSGAQQQSIGGGQDAYVAKFNSTGGLQWGTYLGGINGDYSGGIKTDAFGNSYVVGWTSSGTNISTVGALQQNIGGGQDGFIVKYNSNGIRQWGTYLGGSGFEQLQTITLDLSGNIIVAGLADDSTNVVTNGAYQTICGGNMDAVVVKVDPTGNNILWGTYLGGAGLDQVMGLTTDLLGNILICGNTTSTSNISVQGAYQMNYGGGNNDGFVSKFNSGGNLIWSSYYGGANDENCEGIVANNSIYLAGFSASLNAISTPNSYQQTYAGGDHDAFLIKFKNGCFYPANANSPLCSGQTLNLSTSSGVSYNWSGSNAFNSSQQNPTIPFSTNLNAGNYSVTVVDGNNCTSTASVNVIVNPLPTITSSSNSPLCVGQILNLTSTGGNQYSWTGVNGFNSNQANASKANVTLADSGAYSITVTDSNSCSKSNSLFVAVHSLPVPTISLNSPVCLGKTLNLNSSGGTSYSWSGVNGFNSIQQNPSIDSVTLANSGSYTVTVTNTNNCSASISSTANVFATPSQTLCVVTVDSNSTHNIIVWEKPNDLSAYDSFFIYREITTNNYQKIGSVYRDSLSSFDDFGSNPNQQAYRYKITVLDTCGNEGSLDSTYYHNTIHLQYLANGNFIWNEYRIEGQGTVVSAYNVWRDALGNGNWFQIGTVAGTQTTYTDATYSSFTNPVYRIDVSWLSGHVCTPTRSSVNTTLSNTKAINTTGLQDDFSLEGIQIYPNPSSGIFTLNVKSKEPQLEISCINAIGQTVYRDRFELNNGELKTKINLSSFAKGLYLVQIKSNGKSTYRKVTVTD